MNLGTMRFGSYIMTVDFGKAERAVISQWRMVAVSPIGYRLEKIEDNALQPTPKQNNDGRTTCYACGAPVKQVASIGSVMGVCTKCGK